MRTLNNGRSAAELLGEEEPPSVFEIASCLCNETQSARVQILGLPLRKALSKP